MEQVDEIFSSPDKLKHEVDNNIAQNPVSKTLINNQVKISFSKESLEENAVFSSSNSSDILNELLIYDIGIIEKKTYLLTNFSIFKLDKKNSIYINFRTLNSSFWKPTFNIRWSYKIQ
jgi:hypothetical protein